MCGQWGDSGYCKGAAVTNELPLAVWKKLVDETAGRRSIICIRGGEPFLYPGIIELLSYIKKKDVFVSIDTNGTLLEQYAADIVRLGIDNITVSIDGPEPVHDALRGVQGSFRRIAAGVRKIRQLEKEKDAHKGSVIQTLCCVISADSYKTLPQMPDVARELEIPAIALVPGYYCDKRTGEEYEKIMAQEFQCSARSWKGFCRETSGVDIGELPALLQGFRDNLKDRSLITFMEFSPDEYVAWFSDCSSPVGRKSCGNPRRLIDIQPDGTANFCVDFPDYSLGNIVDSSIEAVWNSAEADRFRAYLAKSLLPICQRCGAKYI
jgi:MoaA/NifB/PqqE/SkfB family radical SAM enzyme